MAERPKGWGFWENAGLTVILLGAAMWILAVSWFVYAIAWLLLLFAGG